MTIFRVRFFLTELDGFFPDVLAEPSSEVLFSALYE